MNARLLFTAALISSFVSVSFAASFQGIGFLPGGDFSAAYGISADGSTVVGQGHSNSATAEAFRWTASGGMVGLGDLPGGTFDSHAVGVSGDGSVVVGRSSNSTYTAGAFRWTSSGGMVDFAGEYYSEGHAISSDGLVIVGWTGNGNAFRWTSSGGTVHLGDLAGGATWSGANGVSADGSVVVGGSSSSLGDEAFRWTASDGMVGLGDLAGGSYSSFANATSSDGSVVVGYGNSALGKEAFYWNATSGMVGLGDLAGGVFNSTANAVSADGSVIVGYGYTTVSGTEAFYWTKSSGMQSLKDTLTNQCGLDLTGWVLGSATGISADGRTIAGYGRDPQGYGEAWIATIPEPATLLLLGLGGVLLRRKRS